VIVAIVIQTRSAPAPEPVEQQGVPPPH